MARVDSAAMARPTKNTTQLSVRLPNEQLAEIDDLLTKPDALNGVLPGLGYGNRIDVIRVAVTLGLNDIKARVLAHAFGEKRLADIAAKRTKKK